MIEVQQGVVAFVGRAADAVSDEDDAESMIDCPHDRRRHADVGFRAGHDQRVCLAGTEMLPQSNRVTTTFYTTYAAVDGSLPEREALND